MQPSLNLTKPESISQVYELLTDLHAREPLRVTYMVELGTIEHPHNFGIMRMNPSDMPNIGIYCSLDLTAPYYLACYNLSDLVWHI